MKITEVTKKVNEATDDELRAIARQIHGNLGNRITGAGTDEKAIQAALGGVTSRDDFNRLQRIYAQAYPHNPDDEGLFGSVRTGELLGDLQGAMNPGDFRNFVQAPLATAGVMAEPVAPRRGRGGASGGAAYADPLPEPEPAPDTTTSPSGRDPNDPRGDQTAPPPRAEEPPAEPVTPPTRPGQETSGANFGEITSNLRRGSRGEGVRALQQRLGINADGIFGPATEQAVRAFQQENNLQVDGVVGRQTLAALQGGEAQQPGRIGNAPATTAPATSPAPQERPVDPQAAAAVARTDNIGRRRIGTDAGDGLVWIVGNTNALTRVRPNDPRVAAQRAAVAARGNESISRTETSLVEGIKKLAGLSNKKKINEASVTINGAAEEIAELMRMMQLAGAAGSKPVDTTMINQPDSHTGGCGCSSCSEKQGPSEPSMGDMISMISKEEEELDGDFQDATTEPDEDYANDVSASIPSGNDLHKEKGSYPATAGGDNPMNTPESIKEQLMKALAEKKAKPDFLDVDKDGDKKEPMKKALKDKEKK